MEEKKPKILIVEDDQLLLDLIKRKLTAEGFSVVSAINGKEGLDKTFTEKPDLILLDIILPMIDGFNVLRQIKEHEDQKISKIPVVLLSNLGQESDIEKGKKLGAEDYLIKAAFTIDQIIEKIRKYL